MVYLVILPHASYLILVVLHTGPAYELFYCFCSSNKFLWELFYDFNMISKSIYKMFFIEYIREVTADEGNELKNSNIQTCCTSN